MSGGVGGAGNQSGPDPINPTIAFGRIARYAKLGGQTRLAPVVARLRQSPARVSVCAPYGRCACASPRVSGRPPMPKGRERGPIGPKGHMVWKGRKGRWAAPETRGTDPSRSCRRSLASVPRAGFRLRSRWSLRLRQSPSFGQTTYAEGEEEHGASGCCGFAQHDGGGCGGVLFRIF